MSKPAALCITKQALQSIKSVQDIKEEDLAFINRKVVDAKDTSLGELFPQIIPVITIKTVDNKYLTYARNGNETRLHGSRSLSVGGHIDIDDYISAMSMINCITEAAHREVLEEIGLRVWFELPDFTNIIYTTVDNVSKVHVGLFTELAIKSRDLIQPSDELHDIKFLTKDQLVKNIHQYEHWSQHIIKNLI